MRIGIVADTHLRGERPLPPACVTLLRDTDLILHAGDLASPATLRALEAIGPRVVAVHGNVDEPDLRALLPERTVVAIGGRSLAIVHDAGPAIGRLERLRGWFPTADAVVFGHSHVPLVESTPDGFQIFNPGSPTQRRAQPRHTMGIGHVEEVGIRFELVLL
jgi:uncharacterized protein